MAKLIPYSKDNLPHIIRLLEPGVDVDGFLDYYNEQFATYSGSSDVCILLKDERHLLACAHLIANGPRQYLVRIGRVDDLSEADWQGFWKSCCAAACEIANGPVSIQAVIDSDLPMQTRLKEFGFVPTRELVEMSYPLSKLESAPPSVVENFSIRPLSQASELDSTWIEIFNQGMGEIYDLPPWDSGQLERRRKIARNMDRMYLGYIDERPVTAIFLDLVDSKLGEARIYVAFPAAHKSKSAARKVLHYVLSEINKQNLSRVNILLDAQSQATSLMFKMAGFEPRRKMTALKISVVNAEAAATSDAVAEDQEANLTNNKINGFYGSSFHSFSSRGEKE